MDQNKHKFYMMQILRDIFTDAELAPLLGFKGGTALMFFYSLPRFSVDLDFNLLNPAKEDFVYQRVRDILKRYGKIDDEAKKFFGPILVLDYGVGERKLKVEISNRQFENNYEVRNLFGISVRVLTKPDMFAHKLCALLDRNEMTGRDIFDCWFFLKEHTAINAGIVEARMQMPLADYIGMCIDRLHDTSDKQVMSGLGEVTEGKVKAFAKNGLRTELIQLLRFFQAFPNISDKT